MINKRSSIKITDTSLHRGAKIKAAKLGITLGEYIENLIREDVKTKQKKVK